MFFQGCVILHPRWERDHATLGKAFLIDSVQFSHESSHELETALFLGDIEILIVVFNLDISIMRLLTCEGSHDQAYKLKFRLRELISCFCCVQTSHAALKSDSQGRSGT